MQIALVVVANPFKALDHEGRPACAVNYPGSTAIVGGSFDQKAFEASQAASVSGEGKHAFVFSDEPVSVLCDSIATFAYFRNRVLEGALFAGNKATASKCGVEFVEPKAALADAKAKAAKEFEDATGELPAFAKTPKAAPAAKKEA